MTRSLAVAIALSMILAAHASAALVLDFRDPSPAGPSDGTAGETLETGAPFVVGSLMVTATPTGTNLNSDGLLANADSFGVDSTNFPGFVDIPDDIQFDAAETLAIGFDQDIQILEIDLQGLVGTEVGRVTAGAFTIDLFTSVAGFNGTTDVFTPAVPIYVEAGTPVLFETIAPGAEFGLQGMTIQIVVPEPATAMLGLMGMVTLIRRRRSLIQ